METLFENGIYKYNNTETVCGIYGIVNNITKKWYIGQSIDVLRRTMTYINQGPCKKQTCFYRAVNKYGIESFSGYLLEKCEHSMLDEKEIYYGNAMSSMSPSGYNLRLGQGKSIVSDETKKKLSIAQKEVIKNVGHQSLGRKHNPDTIKKMTGRVRTQEHKDNISKSRAGGIAWNKGKKTSVMSRNERYRFNKVVKWLEETSPEFCNINN